MSMNGYKKMAMVLLIPAMLLMACQRLDAAEEIPRYPEPMDFGEMTEGGIFRFALLFEGPGTDVDHGVYWNVNGLDKYPLWLNGTELHVQGDRIHLDNGWLMVAVKNLPIGRQVLQMDLVSPHGKHVRKVFCVHVKLKEPEMYTPSYGPVIGVVTTYYPPGVIPW